MSENHVIDNLKKFGAEFQIKCISGILSDKTFVERLSGSSNSELFVQPFVLNDRLIKPFLLFL